MHNSPQLSIIDLRKTLGKLVKPVIKASLNSAFSVLGLATVGFLPVLGFADLIMVVPREF